ncbi:MAG: hypothetical protein RSG57_05840, partial [Christensenellaceae bacterium]
DVCLKEKSTQISIKAELRGKDNKKPLLMNWKIECITEQNPHFLTVELYKGAQSIQLADDVMSYPFQKTAYETKCVPKESMLFVNGQAHSSMLQFDTLAYGERTTQNIAMIMQDENGGLYGGNNAKSEILLRETIDTTMPIIRELKSLRPIYALHMETLQTGMVEYSVSVDDGENWVALQENTILPKGAFRILVKAQPKENGKLTAWHIEGISAGMHKVWVEMVLPPSNLAVTSTMGINTITWNDSETWGATYNITKDGKVFATGLSTNRVVDIAPNENTNYAVNAQYTFPAPYDYDETVHTLTRESRSIYASATVLENFLKQQKEDTVYGSIEEQEQSEYLNELYGGNYTFTDNAPPP